MKAERYRGMNLPAVLSVVFITLKLTDNIDWSWWWVTVPLWGLVAILAVVFLVALMYGLVKRGVSTLDE